MTRLRLFADNADSQEVGPLLSLGIVRGVTTNPTILRAAGASLAKAPQLYAEWVGLGADEVFFQAVGGTTDAYLASGRQIAELGDRVVVKLPATRAGFVAAAELVKAGIRTLITAVYDPAQVAIAIAMGARYVAPYLGRLDDSGRNGLDVIAAMQRLVDGSPTAILAASIRSSSAITELALIGVTHLTVAPRVLLDSMEHSDSDAAAALFETHTRTRHEHPQVV